MHLGFGLNGSGEDVGLYGSDGFTPIDYLTFPFMDPDKSYARQLDASSTWTTFFHPTPNATNDTPYINMDVPSGGEIWEQGVNITITWSNQNFVDNVDLDLYKAGVHWMDVATDISNTGTYSWQIVVGDDYKMQVMGHTLTTVYDQSDTNFKVIAAGSAPLERDILINEIMYNTPGIDDEWIELLNISGHDITLTSDWKLEYGSETYTFDGTKTIASDGYLTIALGSHNDGTYNPDNPFTPDIAVCTIDTSGSDDTNHLSNSSTTTIKIVYGTCVINEVTYDDGSPWPSAADGSGPSLERIDPSLNDDSADNFAQSWDDGGTPGSENQQDTDPTSPSDGATQNYGKLPGGGYQFSLADASGGTTITLNEFAVHCGKAHPSLGSHKSIRKFIHLSGTPSDGTTVELYYTDNEFNNSDITNESDLALAAWDGSGWHTYPRGSGSDTASNIVTAENVSSFSDWVIIDQNDPPLPVVLSNFYAEFEANQLAIVWTTSSETNLMGWNIYKSTTKDLNNATKINPTMIDAQGSLTDAHTYKYFDNAAEAGVTYYYWLESIDLSGINTFTDPIEFKVPNNNNDETPQLNAKYGLYQNYPNPFNPTTEIKFKLKEDSKVSIVIYNIKGEKVRTLYNGFAAKDQVISKTWNGKNDKGQQVGSGIYLYKLFYNDKVETKKMIMLK